MAGLKVSPNGRASKKRSIFTHPQDIHCAIYNIVVLVCYGVAFWLWLNPEIAHLNSVADKVAFCLGAGFLLGWISGINVGVNFHNHSHRPIFRQAWLNRWFGHIWTFSGGWPAFYWYHAHVVVHHASLLDEEKDWTVPTRGPDGRFENIYKYVLLHWPWRYIPHLYRDFSTSRGGPWVRRKAIKDGLIFLVLWSIPFIIDPWMGLGLWLFPQWVGNAIIMAAGMYVQHAGCVQKSEEEPYRHSTTFLSKFFNLTMFNIGYHIEHHDYPQVHWSVLPNFHEKMKGRFNERGAHVVDYGYYKASHLCALPFQTDKGYDRFTSDQSEGYVLEPDSVPPSEPEKAGSAAETDADVARSVG